MKLDNLHMRRYCDYNDFSLGKGSMKNIVMFNQYVKKRFFVKFGFFKKFYYIIKVKGYEEEKYSHIRQ